MLDLSTIPVIDNHCHPVLRDQRMDALRFRCYFTEASHPDFARKHMPNTVYYLWLLRQLATFYGCEPREEAVLEARGRLSPDELVQRFLRAGRIEALIVDEAYPPPEECYRPEQMGWLGQCRVGRMLRLETLMQRLVMENDDFADVENLFAYEMHMLQKSGYCALKSIVAYRSGLDIQRWRKDEAVRAFHEARAEVRSRGSVRLTHKPLIDYLLHIAFKYAAEQGMPVQFHTGYGDSDTDLRLGNPLHLRAVFECEEYRSMPVVLLHESYPYSQFGAYLAAVYPHVYFDLSYTIPFLEKLEMKIFTRQALSIAPASKLMYSSDGIHVPEMHWVAAWRGRDVLAQVLQEMIAADELDEAQAVVLARQVLRDTAVAIYKI